MYNKKTNRLAYKSNRRSGYKRNNNFSQSKGRNRGNVVQMYNKYLKLAKETFTTDRVQSEYYYQFTDHYYRLMEEIGINIEENENTQSSSSQDESTSVDQEDSTNNDIKKEDSEKVDKNDEVDDSVESIESIPFIGEPSKKKRLRNTK